MANRGFKGFRKEELISDEQRKAALERLSDSIDGQYIYWTGGKYNYRQPSLRSNSLRQMRVKGRPVSLKKWILDCSHCFDDGKGYDPARVKEGLYLHRNSKPAVYFQLRKDAKGNFVAVHAIPNPDPEAFKKPIKAGQVIVPASGDKAQPTKVLPSKGKPAVAARQEVPVEPAPQNEPAQQ